MESRRYGDGTLSTTLVRVKNIWSGYEARITTSAASRDASPALSPLIGGRGGDNNEVQLQLVRVATLAFWNSFLKENKKAQAYLIGDELIKFGRQN
ncbi:MAG: hypothetical protein KDB01_16215 [Planctomycetaceae bacterium]|nr:hypothetical protein [Planctomycetaceae bacterium]